MSRVESLKKLIVATPDDADIPYMLAMEYQKAGEHGQAIEWFDKTLQVDEAYHYAFYQKARSLYEMGEEEAAKMVASAGMAKARADGDFKALGELESLHAMM